MNSPRIPSFITDPVWRDRLTRWWVNGVRWFHQYAGWLVSITWLRFGIYALVLLLGLQFLMQFPPFTWRFTEQVETDRPTVVPPPRRPKPTEAPEAPAQPERSETPEKAEAPTVEDAPEDDKPAASGPQSSRRTDEKPNVSIRIDETGVRIRPRNGGTDAPTVDIGADGVRVVPPGQSEPVVDIRVPKAVAEKIAQEMRKASEAGDMAEKAAEGEAERAAQRELAQEMRRLAQERRTVEAELRREAERIRELEAERDEALDALNSANQSTVKRVRVIKFGEFLQDLALLFVLASALIKGTYKGRKEAEAKAAAAEETAEAEALKRQLVEARLQTMQAQVEPHFLFNTLASIDHLIEIDPKRASQMQKNLIALLRASMPTMREAAGQKRLRDLKHELAVVRPYLEILSVRMEERLQWRIDVPEGLMSAEFPPMIIQGLVENAIKHGLEPKPEGGSLVVSARIEHGDLLVEVTDTGLGFGRAATAGTGVGLANTRERLQLLYGSKATLTVAANEPCGTAIRIQVPYSSNHSAASSAA